MAFDALRRVNGEGAYANLVLPELLSQRRISGRDAAFATELLGAPAAARAATTDIAAADDGRVELKPAVLDCSGSEPPDMATRVPPMRREPRSTWPRIPSATGDGFGERGCAVRASELDNWLTRCDGIDQVTGSPCDRPPSRTCAYADGCRRRKSSRR